MATIKWATPGSEQSYLTTELNALADDDRKLGAEIDNETGLNTNMLLELYVAAQGSARDSSGSVKLFLVRCVDGTNYEYGSDSLDPPSLSYVGQFGLDADTAARYVSADIAIPPCKFKLMVKNKTGQALAASGNTLSYRTYNLEVV